MPRLEKGNKAVLGVCAIEWWDVFLSPSLVWKFLTGLPKDSSSDGYLAEKFVTVNMLLTAH